MTEEERLLLRTDTSINESALIHQIIENEVEKANHGIENNDLTGSEK